VHILKIDQKVSLSSTELTEPGEYIADDVTCAHFLTLAGGGTMSPVTQTRPLTEASKSVLFFRIGAFGDLILLTPVLRALKAKRPDLKIAVSAIKYYGAVLQNLPYVDELLPYPLATTEAEKYDTWVNFECAVEKNPRAKEIHMTELYAEIAGIDLTGADLKPEFRPKASELIWCNEAYPRKEGIRRMCVQLMASSQIRTYPKAQIGQVVATFAGRKDWEVFLMGSKGQLKFPPGQLPPNILNVADSGHNFRQSAAIINTADIFIGPDSSLIHVAGALDVPAIGLYGPFPWKLRTAYSPSVTALQGNGKCSPCFHHVNGVLNNQFPENCPSQIKGACEVIADIKPERIISKADNLARDLSKVNGENVNVIKFQP
jgi:ADP-heptose:LPS heptosyltransferase